MNKKQPSRRQFLKNMSMGAACLSFHQHLYSGPCFFSADKDAHKARDLIINIRLQTDVALGLIKEFYLEKLGLELSGESAASVSFIAGNSSVTFEKIPESESTPWYHFAFNIPENKILKAREWHLRHTPLVETPERLRDPEFPKDVRHFRHWNAHSLFFYDPAGNLLEYIARHDLNNGRSGNFSSNDILNISEIAFVVDDQEDMAHDMNRKLGVEVYPKTANYWWSMGDENGLLLAIPKRIWGENTINPKRFGIYPTEATIRGQEKLVYEYPGFPYRVSVVKM